VIVFFLQTVIGDETWVYHWDPPTKQEPIQGAYKSSSPPKKVKIQSSAEKFMATIFWDKEGILHIEYTYSVETLTGINL
jgi:hypothetical protein